MNPEQILALLALLADLKLQIMQHTQVISAQATEIERLTNLIPKSRRPKG